MADFIYKISFFTIIFGFVTANGNVEVKSDIGKFPQDLSPQNVTFTCDASNFTAATINWFIDNRTLASYRYNSQDTYPFLVDINPPIPGITVQLGNLDIRDSLFSFQNFTLMADICTLIELNGKSLSCGLTLEQAAYIPIDINVEGTLNATYEAVYQNEELTQVDVHWKDVLVAYQCITNTSYMVLINSLIAEKIIISNANCSNSICSASFQISDLEGPRMSNINYEIIIVSINEKISGANGLNSSVFITSTLDILENSGCDLLVTCPASFSQNCSLMIDSEKSIVIEIGKQHKEELDTVTKRIFNFMTHNGSIVINDSIDHEAGTAKRNAIYIIFGVAVFFTAVFVMLGCIIGSFAYYNHYKNNAGHTEENIELQQDDHKDYWCFWKATCIFTIAPIIIGVIILILWIVYATIPSGTDVCSRPLSRSIAISATALSYLILILSVMVFGGFCISYWCQLKANNKRNGSTNKTQQSTWDFFMGYLKFERLNRCHDCETKINWTKRPNYCQGCGKQLCGSCYSKNKVFIWRTFAYGRACTKCHNKYIEDNDKFKGNDIKDIRESLRKSNDNLCDNCQGSISNQNQEKFCCECNNVLCSTQSCYNQRVKKIKQEPYCALCFVLKEREKDAQA